MTWTQMALLAFALSSALAMPHAGAVDFSTNATSPAPLPADGVIESRYPASTGETAYYFAADLKAGSLASQARVKGTDAPKHLWLAVLDPSGSMISGYEVDFGL